MLVLGSDSAMGDALLQLQRAAYIFMKKEEKLGGEMSINSFEEFEEEEKCAVNFLEMRESLSQWFVERLDDARNKKHHGIRNLLSRNKEKNGDTLKDGQSKGNKKKSDDKVHKRLLKTKSVNISANLQFTASKKPLDYKFELAKSVFFESDRQLILCLRVIL